MTRLTGKSFVEIMMSSSGGFMSFAKVFSFHKPLILLTIIAHLSFVIPAHAFWSGYWVEPYAGYEFGDKETDNNSYDASGLNLGFRLGLRHSMTFFGLEYSLGDLTVEERTGDDDLKAKDLGLFFGAEFPMIRVWLTYWFDSEAASDKYDGTYEGSGGYKLGAGFKVFGIASINFEKTLRAWDEFDNTSIDDVELDAMMVSLSLPFSL